MDISKRRFFAARWQPLLARLMMLFSLVALSGCPLPAVTPKMVPTSNEFFDMPWPNATRKKSNGSLDFRGYTGSYLNPLSAQFIVAGANTTFDFGVNTGGFFRMSGSIDMTTLPSLNASLQDDATLMLVNIDPQSPQYLERIPLRFEFHELATLYRPGFLLSYMPHRGYSLASDATYAAILFTGVKDTQGRAIARAPFIDDLDKPWHAGLGISEENFAAYGRQKWQVMEYVQQHTNFSPAEVAAFTVYHTQDPIRTTLPLKPAIDNLSDQSVLDSVLSLRRVQHCSRGFATFEGDLRLPNWQHGPTPYLISGGQLVNGEDGLPLLNGYVTVKFSLAIGCNTAADARRSLLVFANGTGANHDVSLETYDFLNPYGPSTFAMLSVAPMFSADRAVVIPDALKDALNSLGLGYNVEDALTAVLYYNYVNSVAGIGNQQQAASEALYLRRLGLLLPALAERFPETFSASGLALGSLQVDPQRVGLIGQSQGASSGPLALAIEPGFTFSAMNGLSGHAYTQAVYRQSVRSVLNKAVLGIVADELSEFHPLAQILQTFYEPADPVNYAPLMNTRDLLVTAGYYDTCVVKESSGPMGLALKRFGKVDITAPYFGYSDFTGAEELWGETPLALPLTYANKPDGGVGLFVQHATGHFLWGMTETRLDFLYHALGYTNQPFITKPVGVYRYDGCDES